MPLLTVVHLAELPQLVLLEDAECSEIRSPLFLELFYLFFILLLVQFVLLVLQVVLGPVLSNRQESAVDSSLLVERTSEPAYAELLLPKALLRELELYRLLRLFELGLLDVEELEALSFL